MKRMSAGMAIGTLAVSAVAGCGSDSGGGSSSSAATSGASSPSTSKSSPMTVTVLAAASLKEAFGTIKTQLEKAHPGLTVKISFAGSQDLVTQLNNGADADVVALADQPSEAKLDKKVIGSHPATLFASNKLEIAVPPANPGRVKGLSNLSSSSVDTVLCAAQVPCGRAAAKVLAKAKVKAHVVSYEKDVKSTLAKVSSGDADAAVVYVTDVKSANGKVTGIQIPAAQNTVTKLPIVGLNDQQGTKWFIDAVTDPKGKALLTSLGFGSV